MPLHRLETKTASWPLQLPSLESRVSERTHFLAERDSRRTFIGVMVLLFICQHSGHSPLVEVHVGEGRDADARRLNDVDDLDAHARTDMGRRHIFVLGHVRHDDGCDDAFAGAGVGSLSPVLGTTTPDSPPASVAMN